MLVLALAMVKAKTEPETLLYWGKLLWERFTPCIGEPTECLGDGRVGERNSMYIKENCGKT
jgi:hypothetical protein